MKNNYTLYIFCTLCFAFCFFVQAQVTYNGNGNSGFGGPVGTSSLQISDNGTTISVQITRGSGDFNDTMVMYIANGSNGRTVIDGNVNDGSDTNRRAISNRNSANLNFPPGFQATHAVAINTGFGGLWVIPSTGSIGNNGLNFIDGVGTPPNNTFTTFTFSFDWSEIGLTSTDSFNFVITYGNGNDGGGNNMFSSNEAYGSGITGGNPGLGAMTYTTYFEYPNGLVGGNATTANNGNWSNNATWTNGNPPFNSDVVQINHNVSLNQNVTRNNLSIASSQTLTVNASQTLTTTGGITGAGALTVDGTLQLNAGGFTTIAPTYNSGSTLVYSTNNTYGRGAEWSATSGPGFPHHVTITNGTVLDLGANLGNTTEKRCGGDLTIDSGATMEMALFNMQAPLNVRGNVVNNGTLILSNFNLGDLFVGGNFTQNGTLTNNGRAVFFDGGSAQTVGGSAIPIIFDYLRIDKLGTSLIFEEDIEVTQTLGGNGYEQTDGLVTIAAGKSLTVQNGNGTFEIDAGSFTLESTSTDYATLVVGIVNRASGATINYNRFVNEIGSTAGSGNDLVSPVFSGQTFDDFATENSGVLAASGAIRAFAPFDKTTGAFANFNAVDTDALISGNGYRAATDVVDGATLTFTGDVVTTSPVSIAISNSGPAFAEWNLVGNPYPFFISATGFLAHAQNTAVIDSEAFAVYGYNSGTYNSGPTIGSYTIINSTSNSGLKIAPGQGFFVASNTTGGNIEFTTSMRTTPGSDDFIIGRSSPVESTYINLEMAANEPYRTYIYFNDESTRGLDIGFDAATFGASNTAYPFYSHLVEDNNGRAMALQSLGSSDLNDVTIPLGVHAAAGTALSFSITESTLPVNTEVYLEDTVTETITLLTNESYSVTPAENLNGTGRFFLRIGNDVLSAPDNELQRLHIYTLPNSRELVVAGLLNDATTAMIYDLQGRMVQSQALATGVSNQHIDVAHLVTGVYIVNLNSNRGRKTQKVILN